MSDTKLIRLRIITPESVAFDEDVRCFETCIAGGYVGILPNHVSLISYIGDKPSWIIDENSERRMCLFSGALVYVNPKEIRVFAKMFVLVKNFDRSVIQSNYEKLLKSLNQTQGGYKRMQLESMLEFELQKLKGTN